MSKNFFLWSALLAATFTVSAGVKTIGYLGANSGGRSNALTVVAIDAQTGAIDLLDRVPIANATYIAVNKAKTLLYTSLQDEAFGGKGHAGGVAVYALDAAGKPSVRLDALATTRGAPCHISLSPDETRLVFAEYGQGTLGWVDLKKDGTFLKNTRVVNESQDATGPNKPRQDRPHCHCARVTPDGKYTCIVDLGTDRVKIYDRQGAFVRNLITQPAGAGPRHLIFHPNGKFAFLLFELKNLVTSYRYADGLFTPIEQHSLLPEDFKDSSKAAAIKFSPDGRELFCSNRGHESLAVFTVDPNTGRLSQRSILKLDGSFPWDFEFLPGGKMIAVGLQKDNLVRTYRYDATERTLERLGEIKDVGSVFCTCLP